LTKTYYIFRHGQTYATKAGTDYIHGINPPILDEGIPAIKKLGEYLKDKPTDKNYTSEFLRCKMTSKIIGDISGRNFTEEPLINEWITPPLPNPETFESLHKRLTEFVNKTKSSKDESFAICTHGANITGLKMLLLNQNFARHEAYFYPDPGVLTVIQNGEVGEINFN
jgi:broad specificity phosphatase PhoE